MFTDRLFAVRDLGRLYEIAAILVRHGFGDVVRRLGLAQRLERAGHALRWDHAADLARLQPAVSLDRLRPQLQLDLGGAPEDVFAWFDPEPLAAASIAQVHRARMHDGREVVVKIRRPGISEVIEADLALLARLAALAESELEWLKPYHPQRLVRELAKSLRRELDLAAECRNAERIASNLLRLAFIRIPAVHWEHTGARLNVQDYVDGVPGDQLERLTPQAGFDRKLLAQRGARAVLNMIVRDGLFHADPHPGNVF